MRCGQPFARNRPPDARHVRSSRTAPAVPPPRVSSSSNADDWGRDEDTTNRTLECASSGTVSSVSAMVFMKDSERAASLAGEESVEVGLHLNLTTPFSAAGCPAPSRERQGTLGALSESDTD